MKRLACILLVLSILAFGFSNKGFAGSIKNGESFDVDATLTLAKYNRIKEKMTYAQVAALLGRQGVLQMSSGRGKYRVDSYKWEGEDYAFITVIFTGDKVTSKVQYGLK